MKALEMKYKVEVFPELPKECVLKIARELWMFIYDDTDYNCPKRDIFIRQRLVSVSDNTVCNEFNFLFEQFSKDNDLFMNILYQLKFNFDGYDFNDFLLKNNLCRLLVLDKTRTQYMYQNITVYFNYVEGLGRFIKFDRTFEETCNLEVENVNCVILSNLIYSLMAFMNMSKQAM